MKVRLFDIAWELYDLDSFNQLFLEQVTNGTKLSVSSINLHSVYLYYKNEEVKAFVDSSAAHIDGMPIIWLLKLSGYKNLSPKFRITWVDWMIPLLTFCRDNNLKVFYLGGKPGVAQKGMSNIEKSVPGLIYDICDGYFQINPINNNENLAVIDKINVFKPHLVIVGMGMGRQEKWILENRININANVIITSGAAAEYFSGDVNTPPRWMGRIGLEWLYRFIENPGRFWFRYLIEPWFVFTLFFRKRR